MMLLIRWLWRRLRARPAAAGRPRPPGGGKGPLSLVAHQVRYNLIPLGRSRQGGLVAAIVFPLIFLVLFVGVFGNHTVGATHVKAATYYVPGIAALAVVVASFTNLVTALVSQRESGILRRRRATPVPAQVLIAAQAATTLLVSLAGVAVLLGIGRLVYGVTLHGTALPGVLLTILVGSIACGCLAYALSTAIGSVDSATPTVQAISLPLYFISGVFIPNVDPPPWLQQLTKAFPVQHLADGLHHAFDPAVHGTAVPWTDLAVLAVWAAAGLAVALRRFSCPPQQPQPHPVTGGQLVPGEVTPAGSVGDPEPGPVDMSPRTPARPPPPSARLRWPAAAATTRPVRRAAALENWKEPTCTSSGLKNWYESGSRTGTEPPTAPAASATPLSSPIIAACSRRHRAPSPSAVAHAQRAPACGSPGCSGWWRCVANPAAPTRVDNHGCEASVHYEIRIQGLLDQRWSSWFDGLTVTSQPDSATTLIAGPVADQAALHGLLTKIRDLGLPLISVHRIDPQ